MSQESSQQLFQDLARKYRGLLELRSRGEALAPDLARATMRELSAEFPGCLRELDMFPLAEIERRLAESEAAAAGAPAPEQLQRMAAYHHAMVQALAAKRQLPPRGRAVDLDALYDAVIQAAGECDRDLCRAVAERSSPKLNDLVFAALARRFQTTPAQLRRELFNVNPCSEHDPSSDTEADGVEGSR